MRTRAQKRTKSAQPNSTQPNLHLLIERRHSPQRGSAQALRPPVTSSGFPTPSRPVPVPSKGRRTAERPSYVGVDRFGPHRGAAAPRQLREAHALAVVGNRRTAVVYRHERIVRGMRLSVRTRPAFFVFCIVPCKMDIEEQNMSR